MNLDDSAKEDFIKYLVLISTWTFIEAVSVEKIVPKVVQDNFVHISKSLHSPILQFSVRRISPTLPSTNLESDLLSASFDLKIQWNLSISDMLYSGHLSIADTSFENKLTTFYQNSPLYSGHLFGESMVSAIERFHCTSQPCFEHGKLDFMTEKSLNSFEDAHCDHWKRQTQGQIFR